MLAAHRGAFAVVVLTTNRPESFSRLAVPLIPDVFPDRGPLGGIHAALRWASDRGGAGVCCTPCDAPFVSASLLSTLAVEAQQSGSLAVLSESEGPLGYEPLFAWYSVDALPPLEAALNSRQTAVHEFIDSLESRSLLSLARIRELGDVGLLFFNVNTPADLARARRASTAADAAGDGTTSADPGFRP